MEEEVCYEDYAFKSEYGEEDIKDSLDKIQQKMNVNVQLISIARSTSLGTVHDCVAQVGPVEPFSFTWPELEAEDEVVFNDLVKLQ